MNRFTRILFFVLIIVLLGFPTQASTAKNSAAASALPFDCPVWNFAKESGGIAYFHIIGTNSIQRYAFNQEAWLTPLNFAQSPNAFIADDTNLYVSLGTAVWRYQLDGTNPTHLVDATYPVTDLLALNQFIYMINSLGITSVDKESGAIKVTRGYPAHNAVMDANRHRIYTVDYTAGSAYAGFLPLDPDGMIESLVEIDRWQWEDNFTPSLPGFCTTIPADPRSESHIFLLPDASRVALSFGVLLSTDLRVIPTTVEQFNGMRDLVAYGQQIVVLKNGELRAYDSNFNMLGSYYPLGPAQKIFAYGSKIYAFVSMQNQIEAIPVSAGQLHLSGVAAPYLSDAYWPDVVKVDQGNGIVYMLSRSLMRVLRWSIAERRYLEPIPVGEGVSTIGYVSANNTLYVGYASGIVSQIHPDESLLELPFYQFANWIGLIVDTGNHITFSAGGLAVYDLEGMRVSNPYNLSLTNYPPQMIWNAAQKKLYLYTFGNLYAISLDANGQPVGLSRSSVSFPDNLFGSWIAAKGDGSTILTSRGSTFNGTTLAQGSSLGTDIFSADWLGDNLYAVIQATSSLVIRKYNAALQPIQDIPIPGSDARVFGLVDGLLVMTKEDGRIRFSILNSDNAWQFRATTQHIFLATAQNQTLSLSDDFSNSASGWLISDDSNAGFGYTSGTYFIKSKQSGYLNMVASPFARGQNYQMEVVARFQTAGQGLGILFGQSGHFERYYLLEIQPASHVCNLYWYDGETLITYYTVTCGMSSPYQIKLVDTATSLKVLINGTSVLDLHPSSPIGYVFRVGFFAYSKSGTPVSDARFDNFKLTYLPGYFASPYNSSSTYSPSSITSQKMLSTSLALPEGMK